MSAQIIVFTLAQTDPFTGIDIEQTVPINFENARQFIPIAGKSAYELAVIEGFVGTIDEWLASLAFGGGFYFTPEYAAQINDSTERIAALEDINPVPSSRNITINGETHDLSDDASFTVEGAGGGGGVGTIYGTANRIAVDGGYIDIAPTYIGQNSLTTVGTIVTGVWHGSKVADAYINSADNWNSKQPAISGSGFAKFDGTDITFDANTYALGNHLHTGVYSPVAHLHTGVYQPAGSYASPSDISTAIANLINSAPSTLDTLHEIATALGDDPNFATTVTTLIASKQSALGGTGFVKSVAGVISYDTNVYSLSSHNHTGVYQPVGDYATMADLPVGFPGFGITHARAAYGDHNHDSEYMAIGGAFDEVDPIFTASASHGITTTNISNWNEAYTESHTHANYSVLNGITSTKVTAWDAKAAQGDQGFQGFQGAIGSQGSQGSQGSNGTQGTQGTQGIGIQGTQGYQGTTGTTGSQGNQGFQGLKGDQGNTGSQGNQGFQGNIGNQGATGSGSQGAQGAVGSQGNQGYQGNQGNQGLAATLTIPINTQSGTSYTLVLTDAFKLITCSNAATITVTIPTNSSVAFPVGTQIDLVQYGAGKITMAGSGVTINSKGSLLSTNGQWVGISIVKTATDTWLLVGDLV